jgi:carbonic anhydrase
MVARENVRLTVEALKTSRPALFPQVNEGALLVAGAFYDLKEGTVEILEPPLSA